MLFSASFMIISIAVVFFAYGTGRTMIEEIGLTLSGVGGGIMITLIALTLLTIITIGIFEYYRKLTRGRFQQILSLILGALFLGSIISELFILQDELRFVETVISTKDIQDQETISRSRIWPFSSGSFYWNKSKGIWVTD